MALPFLMMNNPCGTCSLGTSPSPRLVLRRIIESPMNTISGVLHAARLSVLTCMFVGCAGACLGQSGETQQQVELKGLREDVSLRNFRGRPQRAAGSRRPTTFCQPMNNPKGKRRVAQAFDLSV